jgi:uncharacterized protein YeaO (DUF488 family)
VYDHLDSGGTYRVLVDRLWPRGISRATAPFDAWVKDLAPSGELRKWYGHDPEKFAEFARRYRAELEQEPGRIALDELRDQARSRDVVLLTATRDLPRSGAAVLMDVVGGP